MSDQSDPRQTMIELIIAIVDRGKGNKAVDIFEKNHIHRHIVCLGMGTANSDVMDYLGLGETEKDVVFSLAPKAVIPRLINAIDTEVPSKRIGRGIMFTIQLSGLSAAAFHSLVQESNHNDTNKDVSRMAGAKADESARHDLILAIINQGYKENVMLAAREAGAKGGTVIHGRNVGMEGMDKFLGISIVAEKDILLIVTPREEKATIMKAINQVAGANTECQGFIFSLPVNNLAGLM